MVPTPTGIGREWRICSCHPCVRSIGIQVVSRRHHRHLQRHQKELPSPVMPSSRNNKVFRTAIYTLRRIPLLRAASDLTAAVAVLEGDYATAESAVSVSLVRPMTLSLSLASSWVFRDFRQQLLQQVKQHDLVSTTSSCGSTSSCQATRSVMNVMLKTMVKSSEM